MQRANGRGNNELREVKFIKNYTKHALGSVLAQFGDTKVLVTASVDEQKPKWMEKDDTRGWVTAEYSLLPTSTNTRCQRERSKISGRTQEIQRLIGRSIRACVDLEKLGARTITIDADVLQADGSTRCTSICGAYVALSIAIEKLMAQGLLKENPIIEPVVLSRSKIKISKAIRNALNIARQHRKVVLSRSKIKISKAIHNGGGLVSVAVPVVLSRSKIKISKAIHN